MWKQLPLTFSRPLAPTTAHVSAEDVIGNSWRRIVADTPLPTVTNKLRLLPALLAALRRHEECPISEIDVKAELLRIRPHNFTGVAFVDLRE